MLRLKKKGCHKFIDNNNAECDIVWVVLLHGICDLILLKYCLH